jgi:CubicO group peptidase (beta-lactamase class C family)
MVTLPATAWAEPLDADKPTATPEGTPFTAPKGWDLTTVDGGAVMKAPEGDYFLSVVDVGPAADAGEAVGKAWRKLGQDPGFAVKLVSPLAAVDGWDERATLTYEVPVDAHVALGARAYRQGANWTVLLQRGAEGTAEKRAAASGLLRDTLIARGFVKENFKGKAHHKLDPQRVELMRQFVRVSMAELGVPGAGLAFIEDGKIVWEGGEGVRELGQPDPVDAHTMFAIASNTKGMSTLLLATLVDQGKLRWDEPVTEAYPEFRLGSDATTASTRISHLVCACTGLPRKDYELIFDTEKDTPALDTFRQLAATEPTSGFGEVFQYNNLMASAAGYIAGHLYYPGLEIGAAFDRAMQERIFDPLGMHETTFSIPKMLASNHASPHDWSIDAATVVAPIDANWTFDPFGPAGGAWSCAHDVALYVRNELTEGVLPDGKRLVSAAALLQRRQPSVPIGEHAYYGMGLETDSTYGVEVIHHGGSLFGYKSDWIAVPEAGVGAVLLTNSDIGSLMLGPFRRRFLEVLYDGRAEAFANLKAAAKLNRDYYASERARLALSLDEPTRASLAKRYSSPDLGALDVRQDGDTTVFDLGLWNTAVAAKKNGDGSTTFFALSPSLLGFEFVPGTADGKRLLKVRDAQHDYIFTEVDEKS